jgi:cobalt-zinc-cadmium efflux system membrane fusion protein
MSSTLPARPAARAHGRCPYSFLFIWVLCGLGCSASSRASTPPPTAEVERLPEGVVQIPEASRQFIRVQRLAPEKSAGVLRAPARVAFRDGAVSRLGAPFAGRVERVQVRTGDRVAAGAALLLLDCPEAASSRASLLSAQAAVREARAALERQANMLQAGVGTERERLQAEKSVVEADAELARARASVRFAGDGQGTTVVLRAPIAGTVVSRNATVGAAVEPGGEPLIELGDPSELWIAADVFEQDLSFVREGAPATVELPSVREPLRGHVASVGAVVDGNARTAPVRIILDQQQELLRPGMFGRARIESAEEALALPTEAVLIEGGRQTIVYVETAPGSYSRRPVVVAQPVDGKVLVSSGVAPGDPVVVQGALLLDGAAEQLL